MTRDTDEAF